MKKQRKGGKLGPRGKPILMARNDPVAKALLQKRFQEQIKPSRKIYDRKRQRREGRREAQET
ncbi:MAG: hypothetical protein ACE5ER_07060 [Nitrospinaceae bacterium]